MVTLRTAKVVGGRRPQRRQRQLPQCAPASRCSPKAGRPRSRRRPPKASHSSSITQQFNRGTDEGFYGLGQHQNRQMNYNGEDVELAQHNMDVAIPFVVSTRNYGMLWDNNSITRFGNPKPYALAGALTMA